MRTHLDTVLIMEHVAKKFRRGEIHDSLRDLIPAVVGRITGRRRSAAALGAKEFWALQDISFQVRRGEAIGIIGANGAGKSTILKLLTGILAPTQGTIAVRGRLSALIEVGAGFHPDLTGRENVYLNGTILGMTRAEIKRKLDAIVDFAGIPEFLDTPVKRYSSGMYARLGFSVAAHVEPDVLIVDEALSVGDHLFQQKCIDRMHQIATGGTTVLFVSHNLHAVSELCPRSILLEKGRMIANGPTNEVIQEYVGRAHVQRSDDGEYVELREVRLRNGKGTTIRFETGETAHIDVTAVAKRDVHDLGIVVEVLNDDFDAIFESCTGLLTDGSTISLSEGDELRCTFGLKLHLAAGTYHVNVYAHEYAVNRAFSTWRLAASFVVGETRRMQGYVNLAPQLERQEVRPKKKQTGEYRKPRDRYTVVRGK
ncbi:MAG TPA: ABC transporter ATP-binding protein [Gemmatimonadaceae bacterium]